MAEARRHWAEVLRTAERGVPIEVTRNGEPVAAIVPIDVLRRFGRANLSEVVARFRAQTAPTDLEGPDPWQDVRDATAGRDVELDV